MSVFNPFASAQQSQRPRNDAEAEVFDPLDAFDLLAGNRQASITADGRLVPAHEGRAQEGGIDLRKSREWGAPWYTANPRRLELEQRIMAHAFPRFVLGLAQDPRREHGWLVADRGELFWAGRLRTHSRRIYGVILSYPQVFPDEQIRCFVVEPKIDETRHRYLDGHLCLYSNDHGGPGEGYQPGVTTAATCVGWVSAWLHAHEIFATTGRWPENQRFRRSR